MISEFLSLPFTHGLADYFIIVILLELFIIQFILKILYL